MRRILMLPVLLMTLMLPDCSKFGEIIDAATTPISNPVKPKNIYQVKLAFNLSVKGANKWAALCWGKTYKALMIDPVGKYVCVNRRETRRLIYEAAENVKDKIKKADAFVKANPTLVPLDLIDDAWAAYTDYSTMLKPLVP